MRSKESGTAIAIGCLSYLVLLPVALILRGVTLVTFWGWFVSGPGAVFAGQVPGLTFWQAIGLSIVVGVFTMDFSAKGDDDDDSVLESSIRAWLKLLLLYGILWFFALLAHGNL